MFDEIDEERRLCIRLSAALFPVLLCTDVIRGALRVDMKLAEAIP